MSPRSNACVASFALLLMLTQFACTSSQPTTSEEPPADLSAKSARHVRSVFKVYQTGFAKASTVARIITDVFIALPHHPTPNSPAAIVRVSADDDSGTVVIAAPKDILVTIDEILDQIDKSPVAPPTIFIYPLKHASAVELQPHLATYFAQRPRPSPVPVFSYELNGQVLFVAEPHTNSLLVKTNSKLADQVKAILDELDIPARKPDPNP